MISNKNLLKYNFNTSAGKNWKDFPLSQVTILDDYSNQLSNKVIDFIGTYNPDRLLYNFRVTSGITQPLKIFGPYPGWESGKIGGHTMGHYLTACAQAVAHGYGNCKGKDGRTISERLIYIVDVLCECQEKYCRHNGFIFGAILEQGQDPEWQFDKMDAKDPKETWVPWYTMHKIVNGLIEIYKLTGNQKALEVVQKLGEWIYNRVVKWTPDVQAAVLAVEYGGMNDCLYELYKIAKKTGYKNYEHFATAAHQFDEIPLFERVLSGQKDTLDNNHANCTIPKFMGALNRYLALEDEKYLDYAKAFWDLIVNHHTYITGGNSECEFFGKDDVLDAERSNTNCETCNTHNMLKFTRELFKITGEHKYTDYYEHTYINAIMASGNVNTGMTTYFQPMATGCYKVYCNADLEKNYFWCCSGTGLENFTKLGDSFYYYNQNQLFISLYISSQITWKEKGFVLKQTADFSSDDKVVFEVIQSCDDEIELVFRVPDWAESACSDSGEKTEDGFIRISKKWTIGDKIQLTFTQKLKAYTLQDGEGKTLAFKYGPVVLAAELGTPGIERPHQVGIQCDVCGNRIVNGEEQILDGGYFHTTGIGTLKDEKLELNGASYSDIASNPEKYLSREQGKLAFTLDAANWPSPLHFIPYYQIHGLRYGIYWRF